MPDGELISRIIADNDFTEGVAVSYLSQLLSAVDCLHQLNIAHLDIRVSHVIGHVIFLAILLCHVMSHVTLIKAYFAVA